MKARALATLSVLALTAAFATQPARAQSERGTTQSYDLSTRQFDADSAGEYDGRLHLTITPDGIVSGQLIEQRRAGDPGRRRPDGQRRSGSRSAASGALAGHYTGTFVNGKLSATAPGGGLHVWTLEGKPIAH